jgi:hypothetical protein
MKCSQCDKDATYTDKQRRFCDMHYRFTQMRDGARDRHGLKHTSKELEALLPADMKCPHCNVEMIWRRSRYEKGVTNQITLQHWRDGRLGFLCHQCNTRHASMENDSYDKMPADHKFCPHCKTVKHQSEFGIKNTRTVLKRNSYCKPCNALRSKAGKASMDKDKINQYAREYRAKRKAAGNPILRKKKVHTDGEVLGSVGMGLPTGTEST